MSKFRIPTSQLPIGYPPQRNQGTPPIIVRFKNSEAGKYLLIKAKTVRPDGSLFGFKPSLPIFFDDHLSRETRKLWLEARKTQSEGIVFRVTLHDGKIKVRKMEMSQPIRITSSEESQYIKEQSGSRAAGCNNSSTPNRFKRNLDVRSPEANGLTGNALKKGAIANHMRNTADGRNSSAAEKNTIEYHFRRDSA